MKCGENFNNRKFVAGLTLRHPCLQRASALHGPEIHVGQGLLFVDTVEKAVKYSLWWEARRISRRMG